MYYAFFAILSFGVIMIDVWGERDRAFFIAYISVLFYDSGLYSPCRRYMQGMVSGLYYIFNDNSTLSHSMNYIYFINTIS